MSRVSTRAAETRIVQLKHRDAAIHTVSPGFEVLPKIHDSEVDLTITPRRAFLGDQGSQTVTFSALSTQVSVKIGEWVELGSILGHASQVGHMILDTRTHPSQEQSSLQVRVDR